MTFDDDFCQIHFLTGRHRNIACNNLHINWPPPEVLDYCGFQYKRIRYSEITDEQRDGMEHVARGAEYRPIEEDPRPCP
jgi:hypothetical protein